MYVYVGLDSAVEVWAAVAVVQSFARPVGGTEHHAKDAAGVAMGVDPVDEGEVAAVARDRTAGSAAVRVGDRQELGIRGSGNGVEGDGEPGLE